MQNHTSGKENKEYLNKNTINIFKKDDEKFDPLDGREIVYKDLKTIHT